jgi:hypothetical protein
MENGNENIMKCGGNAGILILDDWSLVIQTATLAATTRVHANMRASD